MLVRKQPFRFIVGPFFVVEDACVGWLTRNVVEREREREMEIEKVFKIDR